MCQDARRSLPLRKVTIAPGNARRSALSNRDGMNRHGAGNSERRVKGYHTLSCVPSGGAVEAAQLFDEMERSINRPNSKHQKSSPFQDPKSGKFALIRLCSVLPGFWREEGIKKGAPHPEVSVSFFGCSGQAVSSRDITKFELQGTKRPYLAVCGHICLIRWRRRNIFTTVEAARICGAVCPTKRGITFICRRLTWQIARGRVTP